MTKWYKEAAQVAEYLRLTEKETAEMQAVAEKYPMMLPEYYLQLIDRSDPADPIRKMSIPAPFEEDEGGSFDTSGEQTNTKIPGLQHKYAQTAMVLTTNRCAMNCRHCFRKRLVGLSDEEIARHFDEILDYIREHTEIRNVLLSGGDSFLHSNEVIERYLAALCEIPHLRYIRFGSRVPVSWPERVNAGLLDVLQRYTHRKQIFVVSQFNHPRELTTEAVAAVHALRDTGAILRNQTVLLRGVNDDPLVLSELLEGLVSIGCIPYYVFQCRPVTGVKSGFQVTLDRGLQIVEEAKSHLSGLAKGFKYCMSHPAGKLEILGRLPGGDMIFKYHEAKYPENCGRLFTHAPDESGCWLPEVLSD